ncbi:MAG: hypothetical protein ACTHML_01780 [Ginsengibacter sp.]
MQDHKKVIYKKIIPFFTLLLAMGFANAQVSTVQFGKNRVQYKKFKWQYYQTLNFNAYFHQDGQELAKYVVQVAEQELPGIEKFVEYNLQRRANIVVYNTFDEMKQSNIGLGQDWQNAGGVTKLVNNKMIIYYTSNHADLRKQIREGIAGILVQNILFGEDLGEVAGNAALLDLPQWLIDGYIAYVGENWSPQLDDQLKNEILSGKYKTFYQLAFDKPLLAGHAFWYYIEEKYKKENTSYLLYLARVYKSLKRATQQVTKVRRFKDLLANFMQYEQEKYENDIAHRKNYPKGSEITGYTVGKRVDYFHFNVNPHKRNNSFAVVQYKKGKYSLILDEDGEQKVLLKFGVKTRQNEVNPNYPMMAWDPKGQRLSVLYEDKGRLRLFVYDVISRQKPIDRDITGVFDQVQDMKYMVTSQTLLFSAVRNGHSDIYTYDVAHGTVKQVTDDVYDDLDPSYINLPNKTGIIFSSNRPSADAKGGDTALMNNRFNIFLVTNFETGRPGVAQISQLTKLKFGDARYPSTYSDAYFTFLSDMSGIQNRYAGFFTTRTTGVDTLVLIGDEILRNPDIPEIDSTLKVYHKLDVDSIAVVAISHDSAYVFPLSNYESSILETREAGEDHQVSEVTRQSDDKILYKLRIDENTLRRRNVTARATTYMKEVMAKNRLGSGEEIAAPEPVTQEEDIFQHEFKPENKDSARIAELRNQAHPEQSLVLSTARLYPYKPRKFAADYIIAGFNNNVLGTRYQIYTGGSGPITLSSNNGLNGIINLGTADIMEDIKISGGFRLSTNLKDNDWLFQFSNLRKKVDWGLMYYRNVQSVTFGDSTGYYPGKVYSNLYQASVSYPFDEIRSLRLNFGVRRDNVVVSGIDPLSLSAKANANAYGLMHLEYVYDNTLNPAQNIWDGARYKIYLDYNTQINKIPANAVGRTTLNLGFDGRVYYPIYRNFIWAGRVAGDFSWGNQKLIYYLGGIDNWFMFGSNQKRGKDGNVTYRYFNPSNQPAPDQNYAFQSLAVNLRGFIQNAANGNNATVINSEFRLPVFTTFLDKPINNAFIRNFQLIQFIDLGTAWNGAYDKIGRPNITYTDPQNPTVSVNLKAPGIGPFLGGYGFGARSTLLGYFLKFDAGWPMNGFFRGKPIFYFSMGLDF